MVGENVCPICGRPDGAGHEDICFVITEDDNDPSTNQD